MKERISCLRSSTLFLQVSKSKRRIQTEVQNAELLDIWEALPVEEKIELTDFIKADERLATGGSFTLEEIAEEMLCGEEPVC